MDKDTSKLISNTGLYSGVNNDITVIIVCCVAVVVVIGIIGVILNKKMPFKKLFGKR